MNMKLISQINLSRALIWHKGGLEEWSAADWSNAMAGEAGEVCNAVKKLRRIECGINQKAGPHTREEAIAEIAKEIGDTYLYLDLLAQRLGIDFSRAIVDTFNRVSEREGFPQRMRHDNMDYNNLITINERLEARVTKLEIFVGDVLQHAPNCNCNPGDETCVCLRCRAEELLA